MTGTERFQDLPLEEVMGDRFGRYSKYIIQDRALPDARDGLKPVQRRILYAMYTEQNTHDKPYRKSAKTVGTVISNYHPHGDSSIYEALVRMSQDWKLRSPLIDMQGNNGSIDGDPAAASRYTEARLSPLASELLRDIGKQTVDFISNFDDSTEEPTVLPAKLPNLLLNGSTGISAGYATDIPPHALQEVLDAVLLRLKRPDCTVDDLLSVIKGPDFPTGGIIQGLDGIRKAYETGKGKIAVRSRTMIEPLKGGKQQIVITEIPFEVNKATLVKKIDELRHDKRLDGIAEVRDETDRNGLRIAVELKKEVDAHGILQYLLKNTDLQVTYNFNMVAIYKRRPVLMTLPMLLDAYIDHQKDVIMRRSAFELERARKRQHIVEGLIQAISILDDVIAEIRASGDKRSAKDNISRRFGFTEEQAEAIVSLQLYRLTNTDITDLRAEQARLADAIAELQAILGDPARLLAVIRRDLQTLKKQFPDVRRSSIEREIEEIRVTLDVLIPSEDVRVTVTEGGYVKRSSMRSYNASAGDMAGVKEGDRFLFNEALNMQHQLLLFTSHGNYLYQPVHQLPDIRWKDLGQHVSSIASLEADEVVIGALSVPSFAGARTILTLSRGGQVKRSLLADFEVTRTNRLFKAMKIREGDRLVQALLDSDRPDLLVATKRGYMTAFPVDEVPLAGVRTAGVRAISVKEGDEVIGGALLTLAKNEAVVAVTEQGNIKAMRAEEFEFTGRAKHGLMTLREQKRAPHRLLGVFTPYPHETIVLLGESGEELALPARAIKRMDRLSNGSSPFAAGAQQPIVHASVRTEGATPLV